MCKFKVGDKVRRVIGLDGDATYGEVVETNPNSRIDVRLAVPAGPYNAGHIYLGNSSFWEFLEEDDELPPAPKSVRYHHEARRGLTSDSYLDVYSGSFASGPRIRLRNKDNIGITIDADTALQLAHDLRRMAMDIKRKEKAQ